MRPTSRYLQYPLRTIEEARRDLTYRVNSLKRHVVRPAADNNIVPRQSPKPYQDGRFKVRIR